MPEYYIHPFWLLGITQVAIFLAVATVYFWLKNKSLKPGKVTEKNYTYISYLDKEVDIADSLPEQDESEANGNQYALMALRRGFLDLERVTYALGTETDEFQKQYANSLQGLLDQYLENNTDSVEPEPSNEGIDLSDDVELSEDIADIENTVEESANEDSSRNTINTYENEFKSLKEIIKNQHDAMKALREQLENKGGDIESIEEINKILQQVEKENQEIDGNIDKLETSSKEESDNPEDGDLMLDEEEEDTVSMDEMAEIVSGQQKNINNLRGLISKLDEEHEKVLDSSVLNIERTNNDLSNCLTYLADENDELRMKLKNSEENSDSAENPEIDEKTQKEFETKIQGLETQLLSKDKMIHGLEEKLKQLESRDGMEASDLDL